MNNVEGDCAYVLKVCLLLTTSEDVSNNVLDMCKKGNINISENDIDSAHKTGKPYVDNIRKRTLVYRGTKSIKDVRLKVDLTKKRLTLLVKANEYVKSIPKVKFCYADINCRLKIKWEVSGTSDPFFSSLDQLKLIIEDDE